MRSWTPVVRAIWEGVAIWMTEGSLLLCARTGGLFAMSERPVRWDLFSPPQLMFPDRTDVACPVIAR